MAFYVQVTGSMHINILSESGIGFPPAHSQTIVPTVPLMC